MYSNMLWKDMKRCSVCTLRKTDRHFIRKERIFKTCNKCSEYGKSRRKLTNRIIKLNRLLSQWLNHLGLYLERWNWLDRDMIRKNISWISLEVTVYNSILIFKFDIMTQHILIHYIIISMMYDSNVIFDIDTVYSSQITQINNQQYFLYKWHQTMLVKYLP